MSSHYALLTLIVYSIHKKKGLGSSFQVGVVSKITDWGRKGVRLDRQWPIIVENIPRPFSLGFVHTFLVLKKAAFFFVFHTLEILAFWANNARKSLKLALLVGSPSPLYPRRYTMTYQSCDKCSQAFSSIFACCRWSKTGLWEGLGMRLIHCLKVFT